MPACLLAHHHHANASIVVVVIGVVSCTSQRYQSLSCGEIPDHHRSHPDLLLKIITLYTLLQVAAAAAEEVAASTVPDPIKWPLCDS